MNFDLQKLKKKVLDYKFLLIIILIFALVIRLYFFVGLSASYSLDEGIYINFAENIGEISYNPTAGNELENPIIVRRVRIGFLYPLFFFMTLLGKSNFSVGLFSLLCSLGMVFISFKIGEILFNKRSGLIAAFFASIFPLNVIYGTKVMPDIPMAFFMGLSVYLFLKSLKSKNKSKLVYSILSGIALGFGYLIKELAIILLFFYGLVFIIFLLKKSFKKEILFLLIGFLIIISFQNIYFYNHTGEWFYKGAVTHKAHLFKTNVERNQNLFFNFQDRFKIFASPGYKSFYFTNQLFGFPKNNLNYFGYYPIILLPLFFLSICKNNKKLYFLMLWFFSLFLFLEFGPSSLSLTGGAVNYIPIFKEVSSYRFATPLILPMVLIISYFLSEGFKKGSKYKYLSIASIIFLVVSSFFYISYAYNWHYGAKGDIVEASKFLKRYPQSSVYTDRYAIGQLSLYLRNESRIKRVPDASNIEDLEKGSFVLLGGSRGKGWNLDLYECCYPDNLPLDNWEKVKVIEDKELTHRKDNLKIYRVS